MEHVVVKPTAKFSVLELRTEAVPPVATSSGPSSAEAPVSSATSAPAPAPGPEEIALGDFPDRCFAAVVAFVDALTLARGLRKANLTLRQRLSSEDVAQWCASSRLAALRRAHAKGDLPLVNLSDAQDEEVAATATESWTLERLWLAECPPRFPRLYFHFASDEFVEASVPRLEVAASILRRHPGLVVRSE